VVKDEPFIPHLIKRKKWKYAMAVIERRKGQTEIGAQKIKAYLGDKINMSINEFTKF
jgi:hypothetical protein